MQASIHVAEPTNETEYETHFGPVRTFLQHCGPRVLRKGDSRRRLQANAHDHTISHNQISEDMGGSRSVPSCVSFSKVIQSNHRAAANRNEARLAQVHKHIKTANPKFVAEHQQLHRQARSTRIKVVGDKAPPACKIQNAAQKS